MIAPVDIGETVAGKYRVERVLAKGGMGVVVVARHLQLDKQVAIKFMLPHLMRAGVEPDALERFVREGRAAVRLRGENVGRVLDVDTLPDGTPYMVMEYLEGQDLSHHIEKHGPLPLAESVDYVLQACVAMAEAHLCGIVHRDLKPSNLFVTRRPDGTPLIKVLDFGISKLYEDAGGQHTQTAMIMGSPSYMAPEQAQSARDADVRSDIWSMGVILYECTSRQLPYGKQASTAGIVAQLIYEQPRPLAEVAPNLPAAFCKVVGTCLQKQPDLRHQTIGELASALLPFASRVGRQAAASVHAIIGGGPAGGAPAPSPAAEPDDDDSARGDAQHGAEPGRAARVARPARPAEEEDPLHHADTSLAPAPPSMTRRTHGAGGGGGVLGLDAEAMAGVTSIDLAVDPLDPVVRKEATPYKHEPEPRATVALRTWFKVVDRVIPLAAVTALGALTASVLLSDASPGWPASWIDALNALLHRLGYDFAGSLDRYQRLLVGPALQIAIPLVLALGFWFFNRSRIASVLAWWLGASLVHVARAMDQAPWQRITPITNDYHPWTHWFFEWGMQPHAGTIARVVYWVGAALMIGAVIALLRRSLWWLSR